MKVVPGRGSREILQMAFLRRGLGRHWRRPRQRSATPVTAVVTAEPRRTGPAREADEHVVPVPSASSQASDRTTAYVILVSHACVGADASC